MKLFVLTILLVLAFLLSGCAGLQVRAAIPVGDGKAVVGVDGKNVVFSLQQ